MDTQNAVYPDDGALVRNQEKGSTTTSQNTDGPEGTALGGEARCNVSRVGGHLDETSRAGKPTDTESGLVVPGLQGKGGFLFGVTEPPYNPPRGRLLTWQGALESRALCALGG